MIRRQVDPEFIRQRLHTIREGVEEGIRREVQRLKRLRLPLVIAQNGKVVTISPEQYLREHHP